MGENKQIKDSLFVDLFQNDVTAKENFLSLYNAIKGTDLKSENTEIVPKRLEQVAYRSLYNDVSMLVNNRLIVLVEHQSTVNENMPLRFLLYVAHLYEAIIKTRDKYRRTLVKIPTPEFYVIYNGTEDYPAMKELHLKDAFMELQAEAKLDLTVTVYNVNKPQESGIVQHCRMLNDYCKFIEIVNEEKDKGTEEGIKQALEKALKMGLLPNYLERKVSEVYNFLLGEYDYDTDIAVQREEAFEQGAYNAMRSSAQAMLEMNIPIDQIMKITKLPEAEIYSLRQ
ncbi:MAG: Rpn family recombination-promoting nuclease/putative transposase [Spirochaetales bacterium]|nr:Rpn family recombination-promoting nuclease/putative transposase [Spirochaetales bacterium]